MAQKNIKRNYIYNLLYQVLTLITPLVTAPYISRVLGADGVGIVSYAESIVSIFYMFAVLGITTYGQREISYVQNSPEKRSIVFWNIKLLSLFTTAVTVAAYLLYARHQDNPTIYYIFTLNLLWVASDTTWFFQGMEEFGKIVLRNAVCKLANMIYVFVAIRTEEDILWYAFGHVAFFLAGNLSLWFSMPKYVQLVPLKQLHPFRDLKPVVALFLPTIAVQINTMLGKTMIGMITHSAFENGYFEQANKISQTVLSIITALGVVVAPRIGFYFEREEKEQIQDLMYKSYRFVWFLGLPLCLGLMLVAESFVPWFFGEGYEPVTEVLQVMALLMPIIGLSNVTGSQYLVPTKREKQMTTSVCWGTFVNFALNMIFIRIKGATGAAAAQVVAQMVVLVLQLHYIRRELPVIQILKEGIPYYIAGGGMGIWLLIVRRWMPASIIGTAVLVVTGAAVYFCVLLVQKDSFFLSNVERVTNKVLGKWKKS